MASSLIVSRPLPTLTKKLDKAVASTIAYMDILASKPGRIVRLPGQEPWEAELILGMSNYNANSTLDLSGKNEPGQVKYYLVELPLRGALRQPRKVPMSNHWLDRARVFDTLDEAKRAYGD